LPKLVASASPGAHLERAGAIGQALGAQEVHAVHMVPAKAIGRVDAKDSLAKSIAPDWMLWSTIPLIRRSSSSSLPLIIVASASR